MSTSVVLEYDPSWQALMWAKKNCSSYITNNSSLESDTYYIHYFFSEEKDAILFALRWKSYVIT